MENEKEITQIEEALKRVFAFGEERQLFIDVRRIPLICQSIVQMSDSIKNIEDKMVPTERFELIERVVYGAVAFILLAVLGAVISLVIKNYS